MADATIQSQAIEICVFSSHVDLTWRETSLVSKPTNYEEKP